MNFANLIIAPLVVSTTLFAADAARADDLNVPVKFVREKLQSMVDAKVKEKGIPMQIINNTAEQYTISFKCLDMADGFMQKLACGLLDTRSGAGSGVSYKLDAVVRKGVKPNTTTATKQAFLCVRNGLGIEKCDLQEIKSRAEGERPQSEVEWEKLTPEEQKPYLDQEVPTAIASADPAILEKQIELLKLQLELAKHTGAAK